MRWRWFIECHDRSDWCMLLIGERGFHTTYNKTVSVTPVRSTTMGVVIVEFGQPSTDIGRAWKLIHAMADHEVVIMFKLFPPFVVLVGQQRTIRINSNCLWGICWRRNCFNAATAGGEGPLLGAHLQPWCWRGLQLQIQRSWLKQ